VRISVVIPVLNECGRVAGLVEHLRSSADPFEIIVVDGGSTDGTVPEAQSCEGVRVLTSPRGRSHQMRRGASVATGDVLWFVHADVRPPEDARHRIEEVLADPTVVAGAFRTRTVAEGHRPWMRRLLRSADLRASYTRLPYGDQALFVWRHWYEAVGGFTPLELMEDIDLSIRLSRVGRISMVRGSRIEVSGRRFEAHPVWAVLCMYGLPVLWRAGVPTRHLSALYGNPR